MISIENIFQHLARTELVIAIAGGCLKFGKRLMFLKSVNHYT